MSAWFVITVITIVLGTLLVSRTVRGMDTPAPATTLIFGLVLIVTLVAGVAYTQSQSNQREADRREAQRSANVAVQRAFDAQVAQYNECVDRLTTRSDLGDVLYAFADLSDVLPGSELAAAYKTSRDALVKDWLNRVAADGCGSKPVPPSTTSTTMEGTTT